MDLMLASLLAYIYIYKLALQIDSLFSYSIKVHINPVILGRKFLLGFNNLS